MISAKICGLSDPANLAAAVAGGAVWVGLNFFPPSPRAMTPQQAAGLTPLIPDRVAKVGLFVDPSDAELHATLAQVKLDYLQLHGDETPARIKAVREKFGLPVIKAIKVRLAEDLALADDFQGAADMLLFDAKAPEDLNDALPGGNGVPFDWNLLKGAKFTCPWMLSGGLDPDNVAAAVAATGARAVDVSSGVESAPGKKQPARIKAFLDAVRRL